MKRLFRPLVLLLGIVCQASFIAAPRDADWEKVNAAIKNDQPKTAAELLRAIAPQAFADQAWAEGAKAVALRIALEHQPDKEPVEAVRQIAEAIPQAPPEARPVLKLLEARWLLRYYTINGTKIRNRSEASADGQDVETWGTTRLLAEIDRRFQETLADRDTLRKIPIADFDTLLGPGELTDDLRPTLYDFFAHAVIGFYFPPEPDFDAPPEPFAFAPDSPAFAPVEAFLAWHPAAPDKPSPRHRALLLYQELLNFHRQDANPTAFLHCDLERLRWAGAVAADATPARAPALDRALRAFIAAHPDHPLSSDARATLAGGLILEKKFKEAHDIAKAGWDAFPNHRFGEECCNIVTVLEAREISVFVPDRWTGSGEQIAVSHANVDHVWFRAYRQPWQPSPESLIYEPNPAPTGEAEPEARIAAMTRLLHAKPAMEWDAPLPDAHDLAPRYSLLNSPADLAPGFYWIVASGQAAFDLSNNHLSLTSVHVTTRSLVLRQDGRDLTGLVTDARSGAPLAGIPVVCHMAREDGHGLLTKATTSDADGWFRIPNPGTDDAWLLVVAGTGDDRAMARTRWWKRGESPISDDHDTAMFFTDRAIYRPGQTIQFKGIWYHCNWRKCDYRVIPGKSATVGLYGPNDSKLGTVECVANDFGSFSGSLVLPVGCIGGYYSVAVKDAGGTQVRVEEYKRPKFTAKISRPAGPATLGQPVRLTGVATALTGTPLDGATVRWHVSRSVSWGMAAGQASLLPPVGDVLFQGTTTTAADGTFAITFTAEADPKMDAIPGPVCTYQVEANITDPTGETRTVEESVSAAETQLAATLSAPLILLAEQSVVLQIRTTTHDGNGSPAAGKLTIYRLKEPATCPRGDELERDSRNAGLLPANESSDPAAWELAEPAAEVAVQTVARKTGNLEPGEADASFSLTAGAYRAIFVGHDANGREFKATEQVQVVDPTALRFPTKVPFFTARNTAMLEPGQPFTLVWGSGHPTARACVEWFCGGVLIKREWSAPGRTQQVFSFTPGEDQRGGFSVIVTQTTLNCLHESADEILVPWSNKRLALRWEHLSSKLQPGAKDTWTAVINAPGGAPATAEMAATLYDASLDAFATPSDPRGRLFREETAPFSGQQMESQTQPSGPVASWDQLWLDGVDAPLRSFRHDEILRPGDWTRNIRISRRMGLEPLGEGLACNSVGGGDPFSSAGHYLEAWTPGERRPSIVMTPPRRNLRETAFFFPNLTANEKGEVRLSFTMPEALTTWRFLGFAHDRELRSGFLEGQTITAKDLMVQPNPPRFLREGDTLAFTVKISNQSDREQAGTARLDLTDSATLKDATAALGLTAPEQRWTIPAKQSRTLSWRLSVPDGTGFLTYRATATAGNLTDGEEGWLPVLPRRIALTESMNLPIRDAGTREFVFQKLADSAKSPTLEHRALQIQSVSEPAWYAVLALPYLMDFPHECAEQMFHRYYSNALARHLVTSQPRLRQLLDQWQQTKALESPLANNPAPSEARLEETPWLASAADQTQARRNLAVFFDTNRLNAELDGALEKVRQMQRSDGLWPWFPGGPGSEHISLTIVTGFARLREAGVKTDITPALKALAALDYGLTIRYEDIRRVAQKDPEFLQASHLNPAIAETLYTRTLFLKDRKLDAATQPAFDFFTANAKDHWTKLDSRMSRAHLALALHRLGDATTPKLITRSLREHATVTPDTGMGWRDGDDAWCWWQSPIETQALMIEAFREIDRDERAVEDCRVWLITRKQTTDWGTTTATADAVHALLSGGRDLLANSAPLQVSLGGVPQTPASIEPGTGFHELDFAGPAVKPEFGKISLTKTTPGIAWAGVHWQYLEDVAKVTSHDTTGLKLEKSLFVRKPDGSLAPVAGPLKVGDELVTRLILRNDRPLEFVHLKDQRGSGTEPLNVLSGYRWQGGLGYSETTRDTASHFFIDALPVGTHVFETGVRIQHAGTYQTGIATIRCMYAPAFAAHSGSVEVTAE